LIVNGGDWFTRAFGGAVDDIRARVTEEPWFERAIAPPYRPDKSAADDLGWTKKGEGHEPAAPDNARDHPHDFER
jgi:hypothetical protein